MELLGCTLMVLGAMRLHTAQGMFSGLTGFYAVVAGLIAASYAFVMGAAAD